MPQYNINGITIFQNRFNPVNADEKLLNLRKLMYTDTAAEIAEERHALLQRFADALEDETISAGHALRGFTVA